MYRLLTTDWFAVLQPQNRQQKPVASAIADLIQNYATDSPKAIVLVKSRGDRNKNRCRFNPCNIASESQLMSRVEQTIDSGIRSIATVAVLHPSQLIQTSGSSKSTELKVLSQSYLSAAIDKAGCILFLARSNWAL
ncbi:hypothetical protein H6F67_16050 [Microcoleus sp. FACHB-1515]|uniref:hypothetical protein n=1 Tax=Cyanophyceae TaxID=3028117 RepID=UPI001686D9A4|nr:hypothetical protein [Microcoleus sp. FACHB-1515]MBD2091360.1 hypothetical protein [Microcoleus sp. FACHB-1515]